MKRAAEPHPSARLPSQPRVASPRAPPTAAPTAAVVSGVLGQHYEMQAKIGEGTYGSVYKAVDQRDKSEVAIKRMKNTREGEGISHTAYREIALVRELQHPNIVSLKEIFLVGRELNLVFEFVAGDLAERIKQLREAHASFPPNTIRYVMRQVCLYLAALFDGRTACITHKKTRTCTWSLAQPSLLPAHEPFPAFPPQVCKTYRML